MCGVCMALGVAFGVWYPTAEQPIWRDGVVLANSSSTAGAPMTFADIIDGKPVDDAAVLHQRIVQGQPGGHIAPQVLRKRQLHVPIEAVLSEMESAKTPSTTN